MKPIPEMKTNPAYCNEPYEIGAWVACLTFCLEREELTDAFKNETGMDILNVLKAKGINKIIDEATGYDKQSAIAWADWVTKNVWGEE